MPNDKDVREKENVRKKKEEEKKKKTHTPAFTDKDLRWYCGIDRHYIRPPVFQ